MLFEYGPECAGTPLFARKGMPRKLTPAMFSAAALQRTLPGQANGYDPAVMAPVIVEFLGRQIRPRAVPAT